MAVTGGQAVAMVDFDELAIAAVPAGLAHGAVRRGAHRLPGLAAQVEARVHRGRAEERVDPHPKAGSRIDLARHRATNRDAANHAGEAVELRARGADAMDLAIEGVCIGGQPRGHKGAADPRRSIGAALVRGDADVGEHGADAPRLSVVALFERNERRRLPRFDPIKRRLYAAQRGVDPARGLAAEQRWNERVQAGFTLHRPALGGGVVDWGGLE